MQPMGTQRNDLRSSSANLDFGPQTLARQYLKGPDQRKLLRILSRNLALHENLTALLPHDQVSDTVVGRLPNPGLDLLDERWHEVSPDVRPIRQRNDGRQQNMQRSGRVTA
jgi:hypothetical protein